MYVVGAFTGSDGRRRQFVIYNPGDPGPSNR